MKILNLLKSKTGKLVMGGTQIAVLTVASAGLFSSAAFKVGENIGEKELAVRSLSGVSSSVSYEGLNRRADGMLTSMNIQNRAGRKGVAVGADRERLEGNTSRNDFGLSAADNLENNFSISGAGAAARTSASDGLGSGGVDMQEVPANYGTRGASVAGAPSVSVPQGASGAPASGGNAGGQLASASMARASGNSFNASSGSVGGSAAGGGASGGRNGGSSRSSGSEGYNFSGAMPSGSNVVSSYEASLGGRGSRSTFLAGGRNATVGRGGRRVNEKDDLKQISKMSAEVAKDRNRGTAAGARPFLANTATSAGMSIEGGADESRSAGSADFSAPESRKLKAIGDWGNQEDKKAKERSKDRNRLIKLLMGAFLATVVAIPLGYHLIKAGKDASPFGWGMVIAGCAVIAAALAVSIWAIVAAGQFAGKWGGGFLSTLTGILGGVCTAALGLTVAAAFSGKESPLRKFFNKFMPGARKLAISQLVAKGQEVVSNQINKEVQKDSQKK